MYQPYGGVPARASPEPGEPRPTLPRGTGEHRFERARSRVAPISEYLDRDRPSSKGVRRVPSPGTPVHRHRDRRRAVGSLAGTALLVAALGACSSSDDDEAEPTRAEGGQSAVGVEADGVIAFRRYFDDAQTEGDVFTVRPDGTGERQLTHPPGGHVDDQAAISPDGTRIAFERCSEGEPCHVFLMSPTAATSAG